MTIFSLFFKLLSKYWLYIVGFIGAIFLIISLTDGIMGLFGFDTKDSLRSKLAIEQVNKETAIQANDSLLKALDIQEHSNKVTTEITKDFFTKKEEVTEFYTDTLIRLRDDIKAAQVLDEEEDTKLTVEPVEPSKQASQAPTPKVTPKPINKNVATVQINAIWSAFEKVNS